MDGLKFSLLSVSKICYKENKLTFMSDKCVITILKGGEVILTALRNKNMYVIDLWSNKSKNLTCLSVQEDMLNYGTKGWAI